MIALHYEERKTFNTSLYRLFLEHLKNFAYNDDGDFCRDDALCCMFNMLVLANTERFFKDENNVLIADIRIPFHSLPEEDIEEDDCIEGGYALYRKLVSKINYFNPFGRMTDLQESALRDKLRSYPSVRKCDDAIRCTFSPKLGSPWLEDEKAKERLRQRRSFPMHQNFSCENQGF